MISKEYYDIYVSEFKNKKFKKGYNIWYKKYDELTVFFKIWNFKKMQMYWIFLGVTYNSNLKNGHPDLKNPDSIIFYLHLTLQEEDCIKYGLSRATLDNKFCINPHIAVKKAMDIFEKISTPQTLKQFLYKSDLFSFKERKIALLKMDTKEI